MDVARECLLYDSMTLHVFIRSRESGSLTMQMLKDSELRYRRLFEAAQDGILILDWMPRQA
jgi:hypothetical protein